MIHRSAHLERLRTLLDRNPVVAILGARQVGKTTLARQLAAQWEDDVVFFDLEDSRDVARLDEAMLALAPLRGLVVLDEIQRRPDLFEVLRVLADRNDANARFLVLGSASPHLLRQTSETLAGRIAFHRLEGFGLDELEPTEWRALWLRGGFPRAVIPQSDEESWDWRADFIQTFVERDLPQLVLSVPARTARSFWTMLAHYHAQAWNGAELARAFGVSGHTVRRYLDALTDTFMVRQLAPWHANIGKRQVKSAKVYLADAGLLHALLGIRDWGGLESHPKVGASWEGFAIAQLIRRLGARPEECFFWATHGGAELDLLVVRGRRRRGFELKRTAAPRRTRSMTIALANLSLDSLDVVYPGDATWPISESIRAVGIECMGDIEPLA